MSIDDRLYDVRVSGHDGQVMQLACISHTFLREELHRANFTIDTPWDEDVPADGWVAHDDEGRPVTIELTQLVHDVEVVADGTVHDRGLRQPTTPDTPPAPQLGGTVYTTPAVERGRQLYTCDLAFVARLGLGVVEQVATDWTETDQQYDVFLVLLSEGAAPRELAAVARRLAPSVPGSGRDL